MLLPLDNSRSQVLVAGGGPVGMVAAYALALQGISVRVLESAPTCLEDMRASTFHPPTLEMMETLGLRATLEEQGLRAPLYQYSNRNSGRSYSLDMGEIGDVTPYPYRLQCEQWKLTRLIAAKLAEMPNAEVLFSHQVANCVQGANGVQVSVETPFDIKLFHADYLIGADGGNSTVRKWMGIGFDGFTYDETFLTLSTAYPIEEHLPWVKEVNYVSGDPFWCVLLKVPGLWRVLVPQKSGATTAEVTSDAAKDAVFAELLGVNTLVQTEHRTCYRVHQRVANSFRQGRIMLAGDSAHLNNPLGGFGMNSGIHDAINLVEKLSRVILDGADADAQLSLYDRQRRTVTRDFVQAQTIANKAAVEDKVDAREAHLAKLEADADLRHEYIVQQAMFRSLEKAAAIA
ncbi:FAD-dependent oxidoreductase [Novosphingobium gossypii]|uniref:FAD-dependent oxidoreductase n=1 Tax=Novosphingobium gossypii TaxID=1604774 RepID=UPI003D245DDF